MLVVYNYMEHILKQTKLKLKYVNFKNAEKQNKQISLLDVATILSKDKRLLLGWYDDILPKYDIKDEEGNLIEREPFDKFIIHLFYTQQSNLYLEYINEDLTKDEFYSIRKMYYDFINKVEND